MVLSLKLSDCIKTLRVLCNQILFSCYRGGFFCLLLSLFLWACITAGVGCCSCIAQLNCSRLRSVEVGRPTIAGPGMLVTLEGCECALFPISTGYRDYAMVFDQRASVGGEYNIRGH